MIKYKSQASQANFFLSENDMSFPAHHYMFIDPEHFSLFTIQDVIISYQKHLQDKYSNNQKFKLDPSIPKYLNIDDQMKLSDYSKIKNTDDYHIRRDKYYYIPIVKTIEDNMPSDFVYLT